MVSKLGKEIAQGLKSVPVVTPKPEITPPLFQNFFGIWKFCRRRNLGGVYRINLFSNVK